MADFLKAFRKTSGHEGGYSNHSVDRGGETFKGISRRYFPDWSGWEIVDAYKGDRRFPELLEADDDLQYRVESFFQARFWDANSLGDLRSQELAEELYDTGVNLGTSRAARFLQEALNLTNRNGADYPDIKVDGRIGPVTVAAANNHSNIRNVIKTVNIMQGWHYIEQCRLVPSQEEFFNGWLERVHL